MTLLQLVSALRTNNIKVTVVDADSDNELIVFFSQGVSGVESDISARIVRRWELMGATAIKVVLEAAP